jgi:plasmid stability protein
MAILHLRHLPDEVHRRLRVRAAEHGRSMEAEARAILTTACTAGRPVPTPAERTAAVKRLHESIDRLYGGSKPKSVVDDLIAERRREAAREASE